MTRLATLNFVEQLKITRARDISTSLILDQRTSRACSAVLSVLTNAQHWSQEVMVLLQLCMTHQLYHVTQRSIQPNALMLAAIHTLLDQRSD